MVTRTLRHIEGLDDDEWAAVTLRTAVDAVAAAKRHRTNPPAELVAVAAMTEGELVEYRRRNGSGNKRLSPVMQLVEAEHLRRVAEGQLRDAHQDKLDAQAATSIALAEAEESGRAAAAAREQVRAADALAARKEAERAAERAAHEQAAQVLRGELAQVRADAAAEVAAAREHGIAAEARAEQRAAERVTARAAHEQDAQVLRAELARVRADAAAEVAAAREQAIAAETQAEQRATERAAERAHAEEGLARLRADVEQARAYADAEVASARGWASGEVAAAREVADAEVAAAHAAAEHAIGRAEAAEARTVSAQLLSIPIPPLKIRLQTSHIENALNALQTIDHALEVGMADGAGADIAPDIETISSLVWVVQEHARYLSHDSRNVAPGYTTPSAAVYADSAAVAFRAFLQRIGTVAQELRRRTRSPDAEIVAAINSMLADPFVQNVLNQGSDRS